jgi:phosphate starvation-inducible PhoH-like protein
MRKDRSKEKFILKEDDLDYLASAKEKNMYELSLEVNKKFKPNEKQKELIQLFNNKTIVIVSGTAGTGKTFCALGWGLIEALKEKKRLILMRPIFESATNKLGYLPGDKNEKMAPHQSAFEYILEDLLNKRDVEGLIKEEKIKFEIPNFLRGSTLKNSIIICDEAQNMSVEEMILVTTRIGKSSKIIFTGDFYQSDISKNKGSILEFSKMIAGVNGVGLFNFTPADNMRHPILVEITTIWENYKKTL